MSDRIETAEELDALRDRVAAAMYDGNEAFHAALANERGQEFERIVRPPWADTDEYYRALYRARADAALAVLHRPDRPSDLAAEVERLTASVAHWQREAVERAEWGQTARAQRDRAVDRATNAEAAERYARAELAALRAALVKHREMLKRLPIDAMSDLTISRIDRLLTPAPERVTDHDFLPVAGHPDDDECTYRSDGTDLTYCGEPQSAHGAPDMRYEDGASVEVAAVRNPYRGTVEPVEAPRSDEPRGVGTGGPPGRFSAPGSPQTGLTLEVDIERTTEEPR
jgi:hypothetical protein